MKILKKGVPKENQTYRHTCNECETKFEFMRKEGKYVSDQRDGDCLKIKCPVCKSECWITVNY